MKVRWSEVTLGDVADFVNGAAFSQDDWAPEGRRIIRIQNLTDPAKPFNRTTKAVKDSVVVRTGDLLVSWSATLGVFEWEKEEAVLNQHIFRVAPREGLIDKRFLFRTLEDSVVKMSKHTHGATMKHINRGEFLSTALLLPPIEEQRRIAAVLDAADALRAKRRQAIAKLDTLTEAIFIDMFGDPVRNDRSWPKVEFEELCPTHLGKMLDEKQQTGLHSKAYLRNANVRWFGFDLSDVPVMDFSPKDQARYLLTAGDVLICEGGEPGRAAVWTGELNECYFQKALHRGRPAEGRATGLFIVRLLSRLALGGGLRDSVSTATISHLTGAKLKRLPVIAPPIELQHDFDHRLNYAIRRIGAAKQSLNRLDDLFASLQQRAFRGEL